MINLRIYVMHKISEIINWVFTDEYPDEIRRSFWEWWEIKLKD